ncbi:MAG: ABC transporter ATP-binding protein [Burkholderiaceae bacterium]|jgi:branched-chain amino acid transport system ATP-binding protein|nr:ABC transporter ATP-binding protein [Burkholderiaceae bacterium]MCU0963626.1 ABC transporter ATP-binding protein [Burkholderiaceae bacterium]
MTQPAIELRGVTKSYGATRIIRGVDLKIERGERHALIGPNGAGKSTLFNLISARTPLTSGEVLLNGSSLRGLAPHQICRLGLSRSFQITNVFPRLSARENIACALFWAGGHGHAFWRRLSRMTPLLRRADEVLHDIGLADRAQVSAGALAYAEQRALEIGMTIAAGAEVILLDEPTAGMSRSETARAEALIRKVSAGRTLVMVEHDMSVVFELADRISVLVHGEVVATGTPEAIRANAHVQEAYLGKVVEAAHA